MADFGLAKTAEGDDLTHTGDILGTIRYMAPERFSGHCDARSDVYSLGLTLYELVALRPAYEASDRHALMERVLHEEPERLKKLAPGVPRDLETIVAKAIARDPVARYATAGALAEDLRRYVEDRPIRARRTSSAERLIRWCRRNKRLAASIGVAAAALVAVAVIALVHASQQAEANRQITRLASNLGEESGRLKTALAESNRRLATLNFERGQAAFEKGQVGVGMLWTVESLRTATEAGDKAGRHVALANLSTWRRHYVELKTVFYHGDWVDAAAFSPDGKTIVTGCVDKTALLWDVATGRPLGQPMEHSDVVKVVAFSPNGKTVLTGSWDKTVRLWDAATGRPLGQPLEHSGWVYSVAFSPDGKTILTGCDDNTAQLWDAATGQRLGGPLEHRGAVWSVAFSPDGRSILTGSHDGTARLWGGEVGQPGGRLLELGRLVQAVAFSRDGKALLAAGADGKARLWDVASGHLLGQPVELGPGVVAVALSPDGKTILTGSDDKPARLWDAATGRPLGQPMPHSGKVWSVAFSPDGKTILTGSSDKTARLWDAATGRPFGAPLAHPASVDRVTFSPDGKTILTGSSDKTARLWDAATGRPLGQPMPHLGIVWSVAFTPDGRSLLTSDLRTARVWDAPAPLPDDLPRLAAWVEAATGLEMDERGAIRVLDRSAWLERRQRLEQLGGPPPLDPAPRLDPILFGLVPTARGDAWKERGLWDRAEAAYAEAVHARPLNTSVWYALARLHVERGHLDRAAATLADAVRLMPEDSQLRARFGLALLWAGDRAGWRRSNIAALDRFGGTIPASSANYVAWACVLGPDDSADPQVPVRLAEAAVRAAPDSSKLNALNTLGAALYRAGRFDEAIRRLEDCTRLQGGEGGHDEWVFLAMAHHRLGHRELARRWLDRLQDLGILKDPTKFWEGVEIRVLRSEAEALILYDPVFPADPFAK